MAKRSGVRADLAALKRMVLLFAEYKLVHLLQVSHSVAALRQSDWKYPSHDLKNSSSADDRFNYSKLFKSFQIRCGLFDKSMLGAG